MNIAMSYPTRKEDLIFDTPVQWVVDKNLDGDTVASFVNDKVVINIVLDDSGSCTYSKIYRKEGKDMFQFFESPLDEQPHK